VALHGAAPRCGPERKGSAGSAFARVSTAPAPRQAGAGAPGAGVCEQRGQADRVHRQRLQRMQQRGRQVALPRAGAPGQQQRRPAACRQARARAGVRAWRAARARQRPSQDPRCGLGRARRRGEHTPACQTLTLAQPRASQLAGRVIPLCGAVLAQPALLSPPDPSPGRVLLERDCGSQEHRRPPAVGVGAPASAERAGALLTRARAAQGAPSPSASLSASPLAPRCTPAPPGAGDAQAAAPSPDAARHAATGGKAAARCASTICSSGSSAGVTSAGRRLRARAGGALRRGGRTWRAPRRWPALTACAHGGPSW